MGQFTATVEKAIAQCLVDSDRASRSIKMQWPRRGRRGFRRIVEAKRNAELALLSDRVFLQTRSSLIGSHVHIRWLDGFADKLAYGLCQLKVEKARCRFVVGDVAS